MFAKANDTDFLSESNSSVDWECDVETHSWSSSASWSDGVEGEATGRLWQQLQDIESVLYGEASPKSLPLALRQEVAQWRATFPHLRVCGTKPPVGPRPTEDEEGQEEVYASHGEITEEDNLKRNSDQRELRGQLKQQVMQKLFAKMRLEVINSRQAKSARDTSKPSASVDHQREPLLAQRQSAQKDHIRKSMSTHEAELGGILRVSPLPRRQLPSRSNFQLSRPGVVLPPIEPQRGSASSGPLSVLGRQTRLVHQKAKASR